MTSHIIFDVTTTLLNHGKYIENLKLTAQAVHMQNTVIYIIYMCNENDRRALLGQRPVTTVGATPRKLPFQTDITISMVLEGVLSGKGVLQF